MARNEQHIAAPPTAVFDVLADPRSYAYWVLGSMEVRDSDQNWPEVGSRFHHTVGVGPLRVRDHTVVEELDSGRYLQLQAKTRPFASARVKLELAPQEGGTRVTMTEDPADASSAFVFQPLVHVLTRARNARSLRRLAELAEGQKPIPGEERGAPSDTEHGNGTVQNPKARGRRETWTAMGRGALAGTAGAVAMSAATNVEMRLRGRDPSYAPAKTLGRVLGLNVRTEREKKLLGIAGHTATAVSLGVAGGLLRRAGLGPRSARLGLFGLAMAPELVIVPALGATDPPWRWSRSDTVISVVHHAIFAATTSAAYEALADPS
jgi:uncharacterized protein YndB with AHSA1/START domain